MSTPNPPHDVPSAIDLIGAVEEFLRGSVLPAAGEELRFYVRVSANVLAIVARELASAAVVARSHADDLAGIGVLDERSLAESLRSGRLDYRDPLVLAVIHRTVAAKLDVARPGFVESEPLG